MTQQTPPTDLDLLYAAADALDELLRNPLSDNENSGGHSASDIQRFERSRQAIRRRLREYANGTTNTEVRNYRRALAQKDAQIRKLMRAIRTTSGSIGDMLEDMKVVH